MSHVLVHAPSYQSFADVLVFAADVATSLDAALTALYAQPVTLPTLVMDAPVIIDDVFRELIAERDKACAASAAFERWAHARSVRHGAWQVVDEFVDDALAAAGNWHDFIVIGRNTGHSVSTPAALGDLLVKIGHPCLIVPERCSRPAVPRRVLVAWNGSREAILSIHAARPLLRKAQSIVLLAATGDPALAGTAWHPPFDIGRYLEAEGLHAQIEPFDAGGDAGAALLEAAAAHDADLLVMGAYGRSRLSEWTLGGATRHVLRHAELPLFMRH